ncbi:hypothetical protein ACIQZB_40590 [Streptomyces sp. NPDC097727]|uniref:hypothetical protein n=1 Tax=Streptomyces sp. NPDC097727 TaxID=3366092 RepID=UPI003830CD9C
MNAPLDVLPMPARGLRRPGGPLGLLDLQIAELAGRGLPNGRIGKEIGLPSRTVATRLYRIYFELGVTSRTQLPDLPRQGRG